MSVNWLERFDGTTDERVDRIRSLQRMELRANGRFFSLSVDEVAEYVSANVPTTSLVVVEAPLDAEGAFEADPSHSLMLNLPADGDSPEAAMIGDLIAHKIVSEFPGKA